ncbi:exodeoxyribonuclease I subunit D [Tahibacter aquaticus]|uniref:Nuclease SbcCD subunit D n=1 Tax=Tahibacter aquaticus TaxID=520092 RepID=A0A4R6YID0_9GAMM|nr:exonuclease SbcCD subunit D C-terminal domain-containing protein [Tahibacter aquaticus]TDR36585.1 exodeoxyribonuclease I subunit D [Tahibacter aquaticus]
MRLLHTSDLHLGKQLLGRSLERAHERFLAWLLESVVIHNVDVVLIAGDVYEVAMPPSYARKQLYRFTDAAAQQQVTTVIVAGNHDSPATIAEAECLLARAKTLVIAEAGREPQRQVHVLTRRDGTPGAVLCGVPFIRPRDVMVSIAGQSQEERQRAFAKGITDHYDTVFALAQARRDAMNGNLPIVATGHLATVGTSRSEAMHEIYVGLLTALPTNALPPADYVALGHIHRPMTLGERGQIRYSGSPVAVAFDELAYDKQVLLVDFEGGTLKGVEALPVPTFQPMARIRGSLDAMPVLLAEVAVPHSADHPLWLEVTVEVGGYVDDLMPRLRAMADGLPVDVIRVYRTAAAGEAEGIATQPRTLHEMTPHQVFEQLLVQREDIAEEKRDIVRALFDHVASEVTAPAEVAT